MTRFTEDVAWPRGELQTYWTEEVDRPLTNPDVDRLRTELGLELPWLTDTVEFVVGFRVLAPPAEEGKRLVEERKRSGSVILSATRRSEVQNRALVTVPGISLELASSLANDDPARWDKLRTQCRTVLSELGLSPPPPSQRLWLTGEA